MAVYLETSSYLPLIWRTPYTKAVITYLDTKSREQEIILQKDCIQEAAGYLAFEDNWRYHPAVRMRMMLTKFNRKQLEKMSFPSTAVQLLLGGNIWPQAQYLNFVRHTAFFFIDLIDGISFDDPVAGLNEFVMRIENRVLKFRELFQRHLTASQLDLPQPELLSYWGKWYLPELMGSYRIKIIDDFRSYDMTNDKLRDIYHYECALAATPRPQEIFVANTGFIRNAKTSFMQLPIPIICAQTSSREIFDEE